MTVSAVTIPTPQNSNLDRAMFVWAPTLTDAAQQSLLNFCSSNGVNVLFLDMWGTLGGGNWSTTNASTVQKFIHYAHASGIRVMALAGNNDWAHNQQWVGNNIIRHLAQFNEYSANQSSYPDCKFDGVMFDVEYWTQAGGYNAQVETPGLCELMKVTKKVLNIPVGCFASQWVVLSGSAQTVTYNGVTQLEGYHLMDAADHVAVACYSNNSGGTNGTTQISMFQPWNDYVVAGPNKATLWCGSETASGLGGQSYWGETKATMEQNHSAISAQFATTGSLGNFRGQCIDPYSAYSQMS